MHIHTICSRTKLACMHNNNSIYGSSVHLLHCCLKTTKIWWSSGEKMHALCSRAYRHGTFYVFTRKHIHTLFFLYFAEAILFQLFQIFPSSFFHLYIFQEWNAGTHNNNDTLVDSRLVINKAVKSKMYYPKNKYALSHSHSHLFLTISPYSSWFYAEGNHMCFKYYLMVIMWLSKSYGGSEKRKVIKLLCGHPLIFWIAHSNRTHSQTKYLF